MASQDVVLTLRSVRPLLSATGEVQGASSDLEVVSRGERFASPRVQINHPLIAGSTVVYPRGVQQQVEGARLMLQGSAPVELRSGNPVRLPGGTTLELAGILQPEETRDTLQGPGVFVAVRPVGGEVATTYLSTQEGMSAEAVVAGMKIGLAELRGPFLAIYDVHRDPGVWFVIVGALLITLGTVWAFAGYLREGAPP